jgi:hypothetical protein
MQLNQNDEMDDARARKTQPHKVNPNSTEGEETPRSPAGHYRRHRAPVPTRESVWFERLAPIARGSSFVGAQGRDLAQTREVGPQRWGAS